MKYSNSVRVSEPKVDGRKKDFLIMVKHFFTPRFYNHFANSHSLIPYFQDQLAHSHSLIPHFFLPQSFSSLKVVFQNLQFCGPIPGHSNTQKGQNLCQDWIFSNFHDIKLDFLDLQFDFRYQCNGWIRRRIIPESNLISN